MLIIVDFPGNRGGRAVAYAGLASAGAGLIVLGTLISPIPWLAVTSMFVLGAGVTFAGVLSTAIAAARRATLMPFVLTVYATRPDSGTPAGWCIAVAVAVPAALFSRRRAITTSCAGMRRGSARCWHRLTGRSSGKRSTRR